MIDASALSRRNARDPGGAGDSDRYRKAGKSAREFRAAGTSVRGTERTTMIVRTGPYRFSRNPIYLSFIALVLGLSIWLNDLWLPAMLILAIGFIAVLVIPREERFLERKFHGQYLAYKATVRRWL